MSLAVNNESSSPVFKCTGQRTDENCIKYFEQKTNFYFYDTPQDGNCLYNSLSLYYTHVKHQPTTHIQLRQQIISYMENRFPYWEQGVNEDDVKTLYNNGEWDSEAGDLTVTVAQETLEAYINLYNIERNEGKITIRTFFYPEMEQRIDPNRDTITLLRIHRGHFGLLLPKEIQIPKEVIRMKNGIRTFIGNPSRTPPKSPPKYTHKSTTKPNISDNNLYEELGNDKIQCLICDSTINKNGWIAHTKTKKHISSYIQYNSNISHKNHKHKNHKHKNNNHNNKTHKTHKNHNSHNTQKNISRLMNEYFEEQSKKSNNATLASIYKKLENHGATNNQLGMLLMK